MYEKYSERVYYIYRMDLNFRGTKLSQIEDFRVFRVFIFADARSELRRRAKVVVSTIAQRMLEVESCIRGFHVYGAVWKPRIGEILSCSREGGNREDPFCSSCPEI